MTTLQQNTAATTSTVGNFANTGIIPMLKFGADCLVESFSENIDAGIGKIDGAVGKIAGAIEKIAGVMEKIAAGVIGKIAAGVMEEMAAIESWRR